MTDDSKFTLIFDIKKLNKVKPQLLWTLEATMSPMSRKNLKNYLKSTQTYIMYDLH